MKKLILFVASIFFAITAVQAQNHDKVALGLRATPDGGGFNAKFFMNRNMAIELQANAGGIYGLEGQSFTVVGLLEGQVVFPDPSWRMFFGGGIHFGVWDRGWRYVDAENRYMDDNRAIFGIDAIGGAEYRFKKIPLGISLDIKPAINFVSEVDFFAHNMFGASARFYVGR
jgi:hypothetical protein